MTHLEPQPADPELRGYDGFGVPIYQWADPSAECPTCDNSPTGLIERQLHRAGRTDLIERITTNTRGTAA